MLPSHHAPKPRPIPLPQPSQYQSQHQQRHPPTPIFRIRNEPHNDLARRPASPDYSVVHGCRVHIPPATVELRVIPTNPISSLLLKLRIIEAREVRERIQERGRNRGERDDEVRSEIGLEPVDQTDDSLQGHGLFDIEIEAV
jgi:hypothetical protein